jgi:hypothetical protein
MKYIITKIARAEYQVIDENGNAVFAYPTSQNDCQQFINGTKADEKFLADKRMRRVAMGYINENKIPVSRYGDLRQFMVNSIYNMIPPDIRTLQRRKEWYRDHLYELAKKNKAAREQNL